MLPKDVIFLPEGPDRWVAMNVFARTSFGISGDVFRFLGNPDTDGPFKCWRIEYFSNEDGLLADPTRYRRNDWEEVSLSREELIAELTRHCILIEDEATYRARFASKRHLLDHEHFGNFHQQHGQHMALVKKQNAADWWMRQKFNDDQLGVRRDTLYGAIQSSFLEGYFRERIRSGMDVLDIGCGTGVYSGMMAQQGANVVGLDPSEEYLKVAHMANPCIDLRTMTSGTLDIPDASMDLVFISDALLFYFVPFCPSKNDISAMLGEIKRVLKPKGSFVSLEPHGAFYLMPWLGDADRPFTVLTEYMNKSFGIVPPLSWLIKQFTKAGLAITDMRELVPAEYFKEIDPRGYHFAKEFPLWHLFECRSLAS
jgi:SAM-dependent methyltransferase